MSYVSNMPDRARIDRAKAAVDAVEKCQIASRAMQQAFASAQTLLLETIPPLLPSVTNAGDQQVVDGLLLEMAETIQQPEPWVTPKDLNPSDKASIDEKLLSRTARDLIVTTLRIVQEQMEQHWSRLAHHRQLVQAGLDTFYATCACGENETVCSEIVELLERLEQLLGGAKGDGVVQLASEGKPRCGEDDGLSNEAIALAAGPESRTLH